MHSTNNKINGDIAVWMIFILLCMISIIEVYSASSRMTYKSGEYWEPVLRHAGFVMGGVFLTWLVHRIPCKFFKPASVLLLLFSYILLVYVFFVGRINDAARWIKIGTFTIQPSEIAKLALIGFVAFVASTARKDGFINKWGLRWICGAIGVTVALIVSENWSTAMLILAVSFFMLCYAKAPNKFLLGVSGLGAGAAILAISVLFSLTEPQLDAMRGNGALHRVPMLVDRLKTSERPEDPMKYDLTKDVQVTHAQIAIATCNVKGKGPGNSVQRDYLPQAFSDFIYAIIIEEWGLVGAIFVMCLYLWLMWRAKRIADKCKGLFPSYLVMGLALMIVVQAMMNMAVAVGAMPVTGQPLPLISRGGTSTFINCVYVGIILSVSWTAKKKEEEQTDGVDVQSLALSAAETN